MNYIPAVCDQERSIKFHEWGWLLEISSAWVHQRIPIIVHPKHLDFPLPFYTRNAHYLPCSDVILDSGNFYIIDREFYDSFKKI